MDSLPAEPQGKPKNKACHSESEGKLSINWWLILVNKSVYGVKISFEMFKCFTSVKCQINQNNVTLVSGSLV